MNLLNAHTDQDAAPISPADVVISDLILNPYQCISVLATATVVIHGFTFHGFSVFVSPKGGELMVSAPHHRRLMRGRMVYRPVVWLPEGWFKTIKDVLLQAYAAAVDGLENTSVAENALARNDFSPDDCTTRIAAAEAGDDEPRLRFGLSRCLTR